MEDDGESNRPADSEAMLRIERHPGASPDWATKRALAFYQGQYQRHHRLLTTNKGPWKEIFHAS